MNLNYSYINFNANLVDNQIAPEYSCKTPTSSRNNKNFYLYKDKNELFYSITDSLGKIIDLGKLPFPSSLNADEAIEQLKGRQLIIQNGEPRFSKIQLKLHSEFAKSNIIIIDQEALCVTYKNNAGNVEKFVDLLHPSLCCSPKSTMIINELIEDLKNPNKVENTIRFINEEFSFQSLQNREEFFKEILKGTYFSDGGRTAGGYYQYRSRTKSIIVEITSEPVPRRYSQFDKVCKVFSMQKYSHENNLILGHAKLYIKDEKTHNLISYLAPSKHEQGKILIDEVVKEAIKSNPAKLIRAGRYSIITKVIRVKDIFFNVLRGKYLQVEQTVEYENCCSFVRERFKKIDIYLPSKLKYFVLITKIYTKPATHYKKIIPKLEF